MATIFFWRGLWWEVALLTYSLNHPNPNPFQYILGAQYPSLGLARVQNVPKIAQMAKKF